MRSNDIPTRALEGWEEEAFGTGLVNQRKEEADGPRAQGFGGNTHVTPQVSATLRSLESLDIPSRAGSYTVIMLIYNRNVANDKNIDRHPLKLVKAYNICPCPS